MTDPLGIASGVLGVLKKLRELLRNFDRKVVAAVVVTVAIIVGGYLLFGGMLAPNSGSGGRERVGGLDLARYCESYGYRTTGKDFCSSPINLDKACTWQYTTNAYAEVKSFPNGAVCFASPRPGAKLGGISNMLGYCQSIFKGSADVQARPTEDHWQCRTRISASIACNWQYQKEGLKARKEEGLWYCYD